MGFLSKIGVFDAKGYAYEDEDIYEDIYEDQIEVDEDAIEEEDAPPLTIETANEKFSRLLSETENIENVYHLKEAVGTMDCTLIFTNKRLISATYMGQDDIFYKSYLYDKIIEFWITSNRGFAIFLVGKPKSEAFQIHKNVDIFELQAVLAEHIK